MPMRFRPGNSIDMLLDDVLLEIFDLLMEEGPYPFPHAGKEIKEWQTLVHVCRRDSEFDTQDSLQVHVDTPSESLFT
jgi:hypothetical protein